MTISPQLSRASRIMAWLSVIGAVLNPAVVVACFLFPHATRVLDIHFGHLGAELVDAVPLEYRIGAMLCALVPSAIASWGLIALAGLFRCFVAGQVFSAQSLRALSHVTMALFWNVLAAFLMQAPISILLTYYLGHGHREISLSLGSDDVQVLFVAGVAYVIARVMAEARRIADENEGFV
jgi:Na+-driven multidrug efflux pump